MKRRAFFCRRSSRVFASPPPLGVAAAPLLAPAVAAAVGLDAALVPAVIALLLADVPHLAATAAALAPTSPPPAAGAGAGASADAGAGAGAELGADLGTAGGSSESARGVPGAPVLRRDVELLQVRPLRPLIAGETCAVRVPLTLAAAAAAAADARAAGGVEAAAAAVAAARFVYARVTATAQPGVTAGLTRVTLETAPGGVRTQVLSSEVFTFRLLAERERVPVRVDNATAAASAYPSFPGGGGGIFSPAAAVGAEGTATAAAAVGRCSAIDDGTDGSAASTSGGVSTDELVGAVRDLLAAAGAPPTLEQTSMLAAHQRLKRDLATAATAAAAAAEVGL
jgi:sacsin